MEITYWVIFVIWIIAEAIFKRDSSVTLKVAFVLFLIAAVLTVINLRSLAEPVMRVSFLGWLIGIAHALIEYVKSK